MEKFQCSVCGYIYNPKRGDPDLGIKASTPFAVLPETWTCPVCGAEKFAFKEVRD